MESEPIWGVGVIGLRRTWCTGPKVRSFFCQCSGSGNTWHGNLFQKVAPPKETLEAIANEAGLEPAYRQKLLGN